MWKILGYVGAGLAGVGTVIVTGLVTRLAYLQRAEMIESLHEIRDNRNRRRPVSDREASASSAS